jgi:pSer/pThr/pTyr-binding forkhead associated (FHA) protein
MVGERGLRIGRDAGCDIVIPANEVSRRHAEIRGSLAGYTLLDRSTNGVLVNGRRVWAEVALSRGDMIRIGREEYRFYAEPVSARAELSPPAPRAAEAPRGKPSRASDIAPRAARGLAALEIINEGPAKGTRLEIFAPVANIGRGAHNDVVIQDESVSEFHAKMQRRDDSWFISDMGSTNGTYVNGERLVDEARIGHGAELRFGGVKTMFRPMLGAGKGAEQTRVIVGVKAPEPKRLERVDDPSLPAGSAKRGPPARDMPVFLFILLAGLVAYLLYLLTRGGDSPAGVGFAGIWS